MSEQIKFSEEEITEIKQIQTNYQAAGLQLVQIKLSLTAVKEQLAALELEEKSLTERILELNDREKELAKSLETKYGKGEIDLESGVFSPIS